MLACGRERFVASFVGSLHLHSHLEIEDMGEPHVNYAEAEQQGYTIVRGMFPPDLCARLRACVDEVVGEMRPLAVSATPQLGMDIDRALEMRTPVVDSQDFRHTVRQPIFDPALAEAAVAGNMIEMQQRLYSATD